MECMILRARCRGRGVKHCGNVHGRRKLILKIDVCHCAGSQRVVFQFLSWEVMMEGIQGFEGGANSISHLTIFLWFPEMVDILLILLDVMKDKATPNFGGSGTGVQNVD